MAEEKKGLFDELFGKKDVKENVEEVAKDVKESVKDAASDVKSQAEIAAENAKRVAEAAQKKAESEARKAEYEAKKVAQEAREKIEEAKEAAKEKAEELAEKREVISKRDLIEKEVAGKAAYIDSYTVTADDTLSHIAARFYGKATPPYYKLIYEHNKEVIGDNMNIIIPGQVLRIPALPDDLK